MKIRTLQQQQAQVGRIRIGRTVSTGKGRPRPEKLDRFRFTSPHRQLIDAVAAQYGGTVQRWEPDGRPAEWEVITDASTLPVLVPPRPVNQAYELWSGAGCQRRCDGETELLSGEACMCPLDAVERGDLAARGQACKATTRLNVMLPDIPGIGVWRLDSHGYYAAIELPQTAEFLGAVTEQGGYVRATLALEMRQVRRIGVGVRQFLVPSLHVDVTPDQLMAGKGLALTAGQTALGGTPQGALEAAPSPGADVDVEMLAEGFAEEAKAAKNRDELADLWRRANTYGPAVMGAEVADEHGVVVSLSEFLIARGSAFAQATRPPVDVDTLWAQIVSAAPEGTDTFALHALVKERTGVTTAQATPEQLANVLASLREAT